MTILGFGFQTETKEYKVLKISHVTRNVRVRWIFRFNPRSKAEILTMGSLTWRSLGQISYNLIRSPSQVMVNGTLHWVNWPRRHQPFDHRLISFDLGDEKFRVVPNPVSAGVERHGYHRFNLVLVNGKLHWVDWPRRHRPGRMLISFDLAEEKFREIPKPECARMEWRGYALVIKRGCLSAAVYPNYGQFDVWIMKDYGVK
ncbi:F-box protein At3g07870-like [Hevea brasiliensis]|uniref:F-box protein At3g07870-like n=1 Tax=Hevea brasiliensis TaxID=3981 RepID=UPI0025D3577A|nr:F-box protein At3g07870-like [Hevea brasiliensis]